MSNLKPIIFLVPVIALILVIVFYRNLLQKADNKAAFKRFIFKVTLFAFILNFAWEVIQGPLYKSFTYSISHIAFCALASVADAIMVLLLYLGFALIYKDPLWAKGLTFQRVFILMVVGGIGASLAEVRHLVADNWAYDVSMPIIPAVGVGLSPVIQFMVLPALIYYLAFYFRESGKMKVV